MLGARHALVGLVSVLPVGSVACTIGEDRYETVKLPPVVHSEIRTCNSPIVMPDKASLKPCADGKGHCYDTSKLPIPKDQMEPCDDPSEVCAPDFLLFANGQKAKTCKFFLDGSPGACVNMFFKQVKENASLLQQDSCASDERCSPCTDPRNGKDTGICNMPGGPHQDACTGGPGADSKPCCYGMGVCSKASSMPPAQAKNMSQDTCPADDLCMPASIANGKPVTCSVLGFSGICMDLCFASMMQATTQITRSSCGPTEVCMPCALAKMGAGDMPMPGCD
jgi:hypothetical protein